MKIEATEKAEEKNRENRREGEKTEGIWEKTTKEDLVRMYINFNGRKRRKNEKKKEGKKEGEIRNLGKRDEEGFRKKRGKYV